MASKTSKSIPILTLFCALTLVLAEGHFNLKLNYEALVPLFVGTGIGGVPISIARKVITARQAIPKSTEDEFKKLAEVVAKIVEDLKIKDVQIEKN